MKSARGNNSILLDRADEYAHQIYEVSKGLPKEELYGITSQLRRSGLSVPLNIVEGFARQSLGSEKQFLGYSYGSLKEAQYILEFIVEEELLTEKQVEEVHDLGHEVGRLLWSRIQSLEDK